MQIRNLTSLNVLTLKHQKLDWKDQHQNTKQSNHHHLYDVQKAMNLPESFTFGDTLDTIFVTLLENLKVIHDCNIVHRDCEFKTIYVILPYLDI